MNKKGVIDISKKMKRVTESQNTILTIIKQHDLTEELLFSLLNYNELLTKKIIGYNGSIKQKNIQIIIEQLRLTLEGG